MIVVGIMLYKMPKKYYKLISFCPESSQCSIYCRQTKLPSINVGYGKIVSCTVGQLNSVRGQCNQIEGFSATFLGTMQDVDGLVDMLNLQVNSLYSVCDRIILCGYSDRICGGIVVDNSITNIQIAYHNGIITVGAPLILGEY